MDRRINKGNISHLFREWRLAAAVMCIGTIAAFVLYGQSAIVGVLQKADAQTAERADAAGKDGSRSVGEILNPDGTLKKGVNGSFDAKGFRMGYGDDGSPVFMPDGSGCDDGWDDRFTLNGASSTVWAVVAAGTDIYVGGDFTVIGNTLANRIAKWNGTTWSPLGTGMDNSVYALAVTGSEVYAGGSFSTAGGAAAERIAKWDGTAWSALGTGMDNTVWALAVAGSDVYAGGDFTTAGGIAASYIARWDGTSWSTLGSGMDGFVRALALKGADLYVGGNFMTAGDTGGPFTINVNSPVTLSFTDSSAAVLPDSNPLTTGTYLPTTCETPVTNFAGAPAGPYIEPGCVVSRPVTQSMFGAFGLTSPMGNWNLYVRDDNGDPLTMTAIGSIAGGWGLEFLPPTAAGVEVSGRVLTPDGRGLRNATVTMTDANGITRTAVTSSFGYYRFEGVPVGDSFVMTVNSRSYRFVPRVVQVLDTLTDVDFVGLE